MLHPILVRCESLSKTIRVRVLFAAFAIFVCMFAGMNVHAQTTEFTYQGSLKDSGAPANANYDFEFALFDALSGGSQVGATIPKNTVLVANGIFSVKLDFGPVFPGANRYLEIRVRLSGQPNLIPLAPRQRVNSAPYSIKTLNADTAANAANATQLGGVDSSLFVQHDAGGNVAITGGLTVAGTLSLNIVNAQTQYNIGGQRILSNAGTNNTFVGTNAGQTNSSGGFNSFFGTGAGQANTSGGGNAFFGSFAGISNTTGQWNSFFGDGSGFVNNIGRGNSFFGKNAGNVSTSGNFNAFFGYNTGNITSTGSFNTFLGDNAGFNNTTGSLNTSIGELATSETGNLTNATSIGANSLVSQSNSLILGSINGTNGAVADTKVGIGTTRPQRFLSVQGGMNIDQANANNGTLDSGTLGTGNSLSFGFGSGEGIASKRNAGGNQYGLDFYTQFTNRISITPNGRVGIGTTSPMGPLEVIAGTQFGAGDIEVGAYGNGNTFSVITGRKANGTIATPSAVQASNILAFFGGRGYGTTAFSGFGGAMVVSASENWTDAAQGANVSFNTVPNGTATAIERMRLDQSGNVGIGTTTPQRLLSVQGGMNIDQANTNNGTLNNLNVATGNSLTFGQGSGEGIASKRNAGGNQFGLDFYTQFTNRMSVTSSGNVGIGTSLPLYPLHVEGSATAVYGKNGNGSGLVGVVSAVWGDSLNSTGVYGSSSISRGVYGTSATGSSTVAGVWGEDSASGGTGVVGNALNTNSAGVAGVADPSGGTGVYGRGSSYAGYFQGNVLVTGTFSNPSDARLKTGVANLKYGLNEVLQLRPVTWEWKNDALNSTRLGLIAQEVRPILPELIVEGTDKGRMLSMNYLGLIPVLVKGMQEQQAQIQAQQKEIDKQYALNKNQQTELDALKALVCSHHRTAAVCKPRN